MGYSAPISHKNAYRSLLAVLIVTIFSLTGTTVNAQSQQIASTGYTPAYATGNGSAQQIKLKNFTVTRKADHKVWLSWAAEQQGQISHFVIERSVNGVDFDEAGLFFTAENAVTGEYLFKDQLRKKMDGTVYYRLRIVDMDGGVLYSAVQFLPAAR